MTREMKRHFSITILILSLIAVVFTSCDDTFNMPQASGRPYEVMVVMDSTAWKAREGRALFRVLEKDIPGLPQPEQSFHISQVEPDKFNKVLNIFRNIIIVDINPKAYTKTKMFFTRDLNAHDQIVMTIQSPSASDFEDFCFMHDNDIIDFFTKMEMNRLIKQLHEKYSRLTFEMAKKMFDCTYYGPEELKSYKKGKDFFWTSNNAPSGIVSICMYSYPYEGPETFNKQYVLHKRDSIMAANIPGTLPSMHMATDTLCTEVKPIAVHGRYAMEARGLWYMENDGMGGPFVSHSRVDQLHNRVVVIEGFVFAPEKMKRGLMRRLEGSLYTLTLPDEEMSDIVTTLEEVSISATKK